MGIDIISGVGYGFIVNLDDEMARAIAEAVGEEDWRDTWTNTESLAQKYPFLSIERMPDENIDSAYLQVFFQGHQIDGGDKYESVEPTKLTEPVELFDSESDAMESLLKSLNLTPDALGWYFYKIVF